MTGVVCQSQPNEIGSVHWFTCQGSTLVKDCKCLSSVLESLGESLFTLQRKKLKRIVLCLTNRRKIPLAAFVHDPYIVSFSVKDEPIQLFSVLTCECSAVTV